MSLQDRIADAERAFERGDLDAAVEAVGAAAAQLAAEGGSDAEAARLAWLGATLALATGDLDAFGARVDDALALAATPVATELAALAGELAAALRSGAPGGTAAVRLERVDAASSEPGALGPADACLVVGGEAAARAAAARRLAGRRGSTLLWIDAARATAREARLAAFVAGASDGVLVVEAASTAWLLELAAGAAPVVALAGDADAGRVEAALRRGRGAVVVQRLAGPDAAPAPGDLPRALDELLVAGDAPLAVVRRDPGRCAIVVGDPARARALATTAAARVRAAPRIVDLSVEPVAAARDAIAAGAGVVLLAGARELVDPVEIAALGGLIGRAEAVTLLAAERAADLPPRLARLAAATVAIGGAS